MIYDSLFRVHNSGVVTLILLQSLHKVLSAEQDQSPIDRDTTDIPRLAFNLHSLDELSTALRQSLIKSNRTNKVINA